MRALLGASLFLCAIPLFAPQALAIECGWVAAGAKYCSANISLTGQSGYTSGTPFVTNNQIDDKQTGLNARNLRPGDRDIFVDASNICRYLDNGASAAYFVPFKSAPEWTSYLNNQPPAALAVPCARELADTASSACGSADFTWQRGKQGDVQLSAFSFTRSRDWILQKPQSYSCNCSSYTDSKGVSHESCDTCWQCVSSGETTTTSCTQQLSYNATAQGAVTDGPPAYHTAEWHPDGDLSGDCDPPPPDAPPPSPPSCEVRKGWTPWHVWGWGWTNWDNPTGIGHFITPTNCFERDYHEETWCHGVKTDDVITNWQKKCDCPSGAIWNGQNCVASQTCPGNQMWTGSSCGCPAGQRLSGTNCVSAQKCTEKVGWTPWAKWGGCNRGGERDQHTQTICDGVVSSDRITGHQTCCDCM